MRRIVLEVSHHIVDIISLIVVHLKHLVDQRTLLWVQVVEGIKLFDKLLL